MPRYQVGEKHINFVFISYELNKEYFIPKMFNLAKEGHWKAHAPSILQNKIEEFINLNVKKIVTYLATKNDKEVIRFLHFVFGAMRKLFSILTIALLLISSCRSTSQVNIQKDVIFDPISPSPYVVEYKSIVELPDSLGGNKYKGLVAIQGRINDDLKIEGIKIMKLLLYMERDTVINYYFGKDSLSLINIYPKDVSIYLPFFEYFVKTVIVKKRDGISNKNMNQITLMLRFR